MLWCTPKSILAQDDNAVVYARSILAQDDTAFRDSRLGTPNLAC